MGFAYTDGILKNRQKERKHMKDTKALNRDELRCLLGGNDDELTSCPTCTNEPPPISFGFGFAEPKMVLGRQSWLKRPK